MSLVSSRNLFISAFLAVTAAPALLAQGSGDAQDFQQTVARVAWLTGESSLQRGDDPDHWQPLAVNVPLTIGDRVYAGETGRLELEAPGLRAFVAPGTELTTLNLTEDVQQYSISQGTATFRLSHRDDEDVIEIDTPNAAITLEVTGLYRVSVDENGNTRVSVKRGEARVAAGGGEVSLRTGEEMHVDGLDSPEYDVFALPLADSWDRWVDSRERRRHGVAAYDYASEDILGASDLDAYGQWDDVPEYGHVWAPANVGADWAPYRLGRWIWQDPWGWTWVSDEPWGWAPYHYGSWITRASRWYWVPISPNVRHVAYAPALVAFVGGGPGWSGSVSIGGGGGGFVGWFPLGPHDPLVPWWGRQARAPIGPGNVAYANRAFVTVVNSGTFVGAQPAQGGRVRDVRILQEMGRQPVLRGPLPVLPTPQSIRPAFIAGAGPRPPDRMVGRAVAARLAPPPAPPAFTEKLNVIRENRGAPMTPSAAGSLALKSTAGVRASAPIRPVAREGGRVELTPRHDAVEAPPPDPIRAGGRALASPQAPFISHPSGSRENALPMRVAPGAVTTPSVERARPALRVEPQPQARPQPQAQPQIQPRPQVQPQPQAQQQPQPERRAISREPRRVAPSGPDPLATRGGDKKDEKK
ncbi:MAG TPA: DUF6600 domain-containing protein [Thermoanaerobaculia bacterium]